MKLAYLVVFLFAFFLFLVLVWFGDQRSLDRAMLARAQTEWFAHIIGVFITTVSGLGLLLSAVAGGPPRRIPAFIACALVGLLLISPGWAASISLALIALSVIAVQAFHVHHRRSRSAEMADE